MPDSMMVVVVRTRRDFPVPAHAVWPLLCDSKMDRSHSLLFRLGVPQPLECRLPEGHGGVGSERECVSDQGTVRQRILVWEPDARLSFRMVMTDLESARSVPEVEDSFDLAPNARGVSVTRTTRAKVQGRFRSVKKLALFLALKHVHRYVFRNWVDTVRKRAGATSGLVPSMSWGTR